MAHTDSTRMLRIDERLRRVTSFLYDQCVCGHMHPEHTAWGTCRGCITCLTDDRSDHPYNPCMCRSFTFHSRRFEPLGTDGVGAGLHSGE